MRFTKDPNNENAVSHNLGTLWSAEEKEALRQGVAEFGKEWAKIVEKYQDIFAVNARTNRNLMDKWRSMETVRMNKVSLVEKKVFDSWIVLAFIL